MILLRRLAFLLLPACLLIGFAAPRGETQALTNEDPRYAFADTTLLRDTLGFSFEGLFPLADSLRMEPASLRSLVVSYGWSLNRLLKMADSLDMPIDSVGPIMLRERFNPLANVETRTSFIYTTTYTPSASGDNWSNNLSNTVSHGKIVLSNLVDILEDERGKGGSLGHSETRRLTSTANWRFSQRFSMGTSVALTGYDNSTSSGLNTEKEKTGDYGFTMNAKPKAWNGFSPSLNVLGTYQSVDKIAQQKYGPRGQVDAGVRYGAGSWLSNDLRATLSSSWLRGTANPPANFSEYEFPGVRARDNDSKVRANLSLFRGRPVELTGNYQSSNTRTQTATAAIDTTRLYTTGPAGAETTIVYTPIAYKQLTRIARDELSGTLRIRPSSESSIDVGWTDLGSNNNVSNLITSSNSTDRTSFTTSARATVGHWLYKTDFQSSNGTNRYPFRDYPRGGYREQSASHSLNGSVNVNVSRTLTFNIEGSISLIRSRYARIDSARTIPVDHDVATQYYKVAMQHNLSTRISNTINFKMQRSQNVNIPAASTASNTDARSYTAGWNWSCAIFDGLTATQSNTISADYTNYPFSQSSNRLNLNYYTATSLRTVLGPRLTIDLDHTARSQPSGNYRPTIPGDPNEYFSKSDDSEALTLKSTIRYRPIQQISLQIAPEYSKNTRDASLNGTLAPQRDARTMKLNWGGSINLPVGSRGKLSGNINREVSTSRTETFQSTGGSIAPRSETRSVNGYMTFTWTM